MTTFSEVCCVNTNFTKSKIHFQKILNLIYNDLLCKSGTSCNQIARLAFIEYFDAPLFLIERIYKVLFDNKKTVTKAIFDEKMTIFASNQFDCVAYFVFKILDYDNNGIVSFKDANVVYMNILSYIEYCNNKNDNKFIKDKTLFEKEKTFSYDSFVLFVKTVNSDMFIMIF